jgi:hypothetical protein
MSGLACGQMLDNTNATAFEGRPEFVRAFMRNNNIYTIRGSFSTKADKDIIREGKDATYYKFNRFGELTFEYKTIYNDTLFTLYVYDERSNVIIKRNADKYGFQSHHYTYDNRNRIVRIDVRTEENKGQNIFLHVPDETHVTGTEKFEYVDLTETSYKKCYLNGSGIIYREEFFHFDEKNRLIRQEGYQKTGSGKSTVEMTYDQSGRLIEKKAESTVMGHYATKYTYEYDAWGNILSMKFYENETYKTEFQYVYDSDNKFLKAIIMRDAVSHLMTIVKYDLYTFY